MKCIKFWVVQWRVIRCQPSLLRVLNTLKTKRFSWWRGSGPSLYNNALYLHAPSIWGAQYACQIISSQSTPNTPSGLDFSQAEEAAALSKGSHWKGKMEWCPLCIIAQGLTDWPRIGETLVRHPFLRGLKSSSLRRVFKPPGYQLCFVGELSPPPLLKLCHFEEKSSYFIGQGQKLKRT